MIRRAPPAAGYPIRAVSKLTGLSIDTLRAWERRYRAVEPRRGERGRLYGEADVQRLLALRSLVDRGYAIGQVARLGDRQLQRLAARCLEREASDHAISPAASHPVRRRTEVQQVLDAVRDLDQLAADRELARLAAVLSPRDLVHSVIVPLMQLVGEEWHAGRIGIAQEHLASALVRSLLGGLLRLYGSPQSSARLLFATPPGEDHEFGILAAAMLAAGAGLGVIYLGPDLPDGDLVAAARQANPAAVVLGIASGGPRAALAEAVRALDRTLPADIEIWVGGSEAAAAAGLALRRRIVPLADFVAFEEEVRRLRVRAEGRYLPGSPQ